MAESDFIIALSNKHEAIIDHLIANPEQKLGQVAACFNVTPAWLSTVIHSDCFRKRLMERRDELSTPIVLELHEKLAGVAHQALDRLNEKVTLAEDSKVLNDVADMCLKNLGYGSKAPGVHLHAHKHTHEPRAVSSEVVSKARARIGTQAPPPHALPNPDQDDIQDADYFVLEPGGVPVPST